MKKIDTRASKWLEIERKTNACVRGFNTLNFKTLQSRSRSERRTDAFKRECGQVCK